MKMNAQTLRGALVLLSAVVATAATNPTTIVGMMYEGWHAPAYWGGANVTVERVLRSNGTLTMAATTPTARASGFRWHKEPARRDSAKDFCRLKVQRCTAMDWILISAYCFAIS